MSIDPSDPVLPAEAPSTLAGDEASVDPGTTSLPDDPIQQVFVRALATLDALLAELDPYLEWIPKEICQWTARVPQNAQSYIPNIAALLKSRPELAPHCDPAVMLTSVRRHEVLQKIAHILGTLQMLVGDTARLTLDVGWEQTRDVYVAASRRARKERALAIDLAPMRKLLKRKPKEVAKSHAAVREDVKARALAQRAELARKRADAAAEEAARYTTKPEGKPPKT